MEPLIFDELWCNNAVRFPGEGAALANGPHVLGTAANGPKATPAGADTSLNQKQDRRGRLYSDHRPSIERGPSDTFRRPLERIIQIQANAIAEIETISSAQMNDM
jgi:hypothetical protein